MISNFTNIHSNIIHNSQNVEIAQTSLTDEWINKMWHIHRVLDIHNMEYIHNNRILVGHKKE